MTPLSILALAAELEKLRGHYLFVCNPADADGVQHALDEMDLSGFLTIDSIKVQPNKFVAPGAGYMMRNSEAD